MYIRYNSIAITSGSVYLCTTIVLNMSAKSNLYNSI